MSPERRLIFASAAILLGLAASAIALDAFGRSRRVVGRTATLGPGVDVVRIQTADQAYHVWRQRGFHGRIVLALSSRLYFVERERALPARSRDGATLDPAEVAEGDLRPESFLLASVERGIAREVRHVLPEAVWSQKVERPANEAGFELRDGVLHAPHLGTPRSLAVLDRLPVLTEPALLFVSASFFSDLDAAAVLGRLQALGITTDLLLSCDSLDDPAVSPAERARLREFERLLGSG
jgi:hypothetical protein